MAIDKQILSRKALFKVNGSFKAMRLAKCDQFRMPSKAGLQVRDQYRMQQDPHRAEVLSPKLNELKDMI